MLRPAKRILIVEDDPMVLDLLTTRLELAGIAPSALATARAR
jgi:DNA-binding response OmpR family regulator